VDNRDLHTAKGNGLLDLHLNGKPIFSVFNQPAQAPVPTQVPVTTETQDQTPPETPSSDESHPIKAGQVRGFGKSQAGKLSAIGITTWELFLATDSASLAEAIGKSVNEIDAIKKEITA
jgi:hypothetical protein